MCTSIRLRTRRNFFETKLGLIDVRLYEAEDKAVAKEKQHARSRSSRRWMPEVGILCGSALVKTESDEAGFLEH